MSDSVPDAPSGPQQDVEPQQAPGHPDGQPTQHRDQQAAGSPEAPSSPGAPSSPAVPRWHGGSDRSLVDGMPAGTIEPPPRHTAPGRAEPPATGDTTTAIRFEPSPVPGEGFALWPPASARVNGAVPGFQPRHAPATPPAGARPADEQRPPIAGLGALVVLALLAGFFAWVSADPFWLALGHAHRGTATVTKCTGQGIGIRCTGTFDGTRFSTEQVALSALPRTAQKAGSTVPARMVSASGRTAYAGEPAALHAWWVIGVVLVVLCGLGIGWATGVSRLRKRRARTIAYLASVGAPLLLLVGMLAAAW